MVFSWILDQSYFLKKMLFSDTISFDPCIFHNWWIIKQKFKSGKITSFFSQVNLVFFKSETQTKIRLMAWYDQHSYVKTAVTRFANS